MESLQLKLAEQCSKCMHLGDAHTGQTQPDTLMLSVCTCTGAPKGV